MQNLLNQKKSHCWIGAGQKEAPGRQLAIDRGPKRDLYYDNDGREKKPQTQLDGRSTSSDHPPGKGKTFMGTPNEKGDGTRE